MQKTVEALKSELHENRNERNNSDGAALSPVSPARSDALSFAEISFESDLFDMDKDDFIDESDGSVGCPNGLLTVSPFETTQKQKRRVAKAYHSPKKWRRMIRNNRLKSIFFHQ
eukprot:15330197-Ditylum_brightwellii.AAC.1